MVFVETVPIVHEIMLHQPSFCRSHCRRRQRGRGWGWPTFHAVCTNHSHECHKQHVGYFDIACFFFPSRAIYVSECSKAMHLWGFVNPCYEWRLPHKTCSLQFLSPCYTTTLLQTEISLCQILHTFTQRSFCTLLDETRLAKHVGPNDMMPQVWQCRDTNSSSIQKWHGK